jgi:hypothetical protein
VKKDYGSVFLSAHAFDKLSLENTRYNQKNTFVLSIRIDFTKTVRKSQFKEVKGQVHPEK